MRRAFERQDRERGTRPRAAQDAAPRRGYAAELAGLPRVLLDAGNSAVSRLLGRRASEGRALAPETRTRLERGLGENLQEVRVHQDAAAEQVAGSLNARAVTEGEDIYLAADAPGPDTSAGQDLLAHETMHVVQQRRADAVEGDRVSSPADASEHAAESAAPALAQGQAANVGRGGAVAGAQRQPRGNGATRQEVEAALTQYFQRALQAQQRTGSQSLHVTDEIRATVMNLANAPDPNYHGPGGDPGRPIRQMNMEPILARFPSTPQEAARQVAQRLPDPFDRATLQRLTGAAVEPESTRLGRLKDLVERSAPGEPDQPQEPKQPTSSERVDQFMRDWRRQTGQPEPTQYGPYSVDVLRVTRIARGLPQAWRGPASQSTAPAARSYAEVDRAISQISVDALIPAEARGGPDAGNYADAQEVARGVERLLDVAQQQQQDNIVLRLPANYNNVRDPAAILAELGRIIRLVRDALPHHASSVRYASIVFGDRNVRVVLLNTPAR